MERFLSWALAIYRGLLGLYPAPFRAEYGFDLLQVFQEWQQASYRQGGGRALVGCWERALCDVAYSSVREHLALYAPLVSRINEGDLSMTPANPNSGYLVTGASVLIVTNLISLRPDFTIFNGIFMGVVVLTAFLYPHRAWRRLAILIMSMILIQGFQRLPSNDAWWGPFLGIFAFGLLLGGVSTILGTGGRWLASRLVLPKHVKLG